MKLQKIVDIMESIAPIDCACEWDNVGLMIGSIDSEVSKIAVSLDFDDNAVEYAISSGADLIITHHPAVFRPIKNVTDSCIINAIKNNIAVYSAHTNLDVAVDGVNYALANKLGLYNCSQYGMLRVGFIEENTLKNVVNSVKKSLQVSALRVVGNLNRRINKVGVLGGSGGDFVKEAFESGCDLFITGECKYDQAKFADKLGISVISAGHFETENPVVHQLAENLQKRIDIEIEEVTPKNVYRTL